MMFSFVTRLTAAAACFLAGGPVGGGTRESKAAESLAPVPVSCERAGLAAERANGVPAGLLLAIGRVETGRWDPSLHRVTAWPWAINAGGKGQWFDTKEAAADAVKALLAAGTRSIDAGCFQINLLHHPAAFQAPEQAFDPDANAGFAARLLMTLFARTGSWELAVQSYHSADPVRGFAYREQVFATWFSSPAGLSTNGGPQSGAAIPAVLTGRPPGLASEPADTGPRMGSAPVHVDGAPLIAAGVRVWTPMPTGTSTNVVAMPPPVAAGMRKAANP